MQSKKQYGESKGQYSLCFKALSRACGADGLFTEGYPAWEYAVHSHFVSFILKN